MNNCLSDNEHLQGQFFVLGSWDVQSTVRRTESKTDNWWKIINQSSSFFKKHNNLYRLYGYVIINRVMKLKIIKIPLWDSGFQLNPYGDIPLDLHHQDFYNNTCVLLQTRVIFRQKTGLDVHVFLEMDVEILFGMNSDFRIHPRPYSDTACIDSTNGRPCPLPEAQTHL